MRHRSGTGPLFEWHDATPIRNSVRPRRGEGVMTNQKPQFKVIHSPLSRHYLAVIWLADDAIADNILQCLALIVCDTVIIEQQQLKLAYK